MKAELYRRHLKACPDKSKGILATKCSCPVWVDGVHPLTGKRLRRSLDTKDWQRAIRLLDRWETNVHTVEAAPCPTLEQAITAYLADCKDRKLAAHTLKLYAISYNLLTKAILPETQLTDITPIDIRRYLTLGRSTLAPSTMQVRFNQVKWLFNFCVVNQWITSSPAANLKAGKIESRPTLPYTPSEVARMLEVVNNLKSPARQKRLKALILLLLYSGLRISDAISLGRANLNFDGRLLIRIEKTKEPLYVRLPPECVSALLSLPVKNAYFFWPTGTALDTTTNQSRKWLRAIGRATNIKIHPHRFRDTFAVELLKSKVTIWTVQKLLGHTSIKTTEKHYSPWVIDFQTQLDDATSRLKFG